MKRLLTVVCLLGLSLAPSSARSADDYVLGPDSLIQPGVPQGKWEEFIWESQIFPNTKRHVAIYAPAQYKPEEPTRLMVFQDGVRQYSIREATAETRRRALLDQYHAPNVFDNLMHRGELPPIIGIFVDPGSGNIEGRNGNPDFSNRSFEYDTVSDQYVRFLEQEILPEVMRRGYNLRQDAAGRAIGGISSGGICAFTAAWHRPDLFSKVLTNVGSFVDLRGGHVYPSLIRETERKPLRVFLQEGSNDNNRGGNPNRSWPEQNLLLTAALQNKGYDYKLEWGDGAHNHKHGAAILPASLKWLWREDSPAGNPVEGGGARGRRGQ